MTLSASPRLVPPFTEETAAMKVRAAEALWNTCDPARIALAYTENTEWRNRDEFLEGRTAVMAFLTRKWQKELDYRLRKTLWTFNENRISVSFEYESHDESGQWYRSYGVELWEFALDGRMRRRIASINDARIAENDRKLL